MTFRPIIALVSDAIHPFHRGGKELRYHEVTKGLAKTFDVHVYTMHWWEGSRTQIADGVTYHALCPRVPLYVNNRRSVLQAIIFALACLRLLWQRFDVLEADHMPYFQLFTLRLVTSIRRKRFVVTWHEVWGRAYWQQYLGAPGVAAWMVEKWAMRLPDHIIAASPQTAERLRKQTRRQVGITVAPNGIDLAAISRAQPATRCTDLVVVGRLLSHKRVDMLIEAVALLHRGGLPVTCRVIGNGPEADLLLQQAVENGLQHAVEFCHDVQEQADVYANIKAARIFVTPSAREGFGIAALEAIACGIPVVTTSAPDNLAQHLVARATHGVVCAPSVSALADALRRILTTDRRSPHSAGDDHWLSEYTWAATTRQVVCALFGSDVSDQSFTDTTRSPPVQDQS